MSLEVGGRGRFETHEVSVIKGNRKREKGGVMQGHEPRNRMLSRSWKSQGNDFVTRLSGGSMSLPTP